MTRFKEGDKVRCTKKWHDMESTERVFTVAEVKQTGWGHEYLKLEELMQQNPQHDFRADRYKLVVRPSRATVTTAPESKATNPKQAFGDAKAQLVLVPDTMPYFAAMAFFEGATKYGAYNWRVAGVRASTYKAACERHLKKWFNGEEADPKTGVPHLANAMACIAIIVDAALCGKLEDDRPPKVDLLALEEEVARVQAHLRTLHAGLNPQHWTQAEVEKQ